MYPPRHLFSPVRTFDSYRPTFSLADENSPPSSSLPSLLPSPPSSPCLSPTPYTPHTDVRPALLIMPHTPQRPEKCIPSHPESGTETVTPSPGSSTFPSVLTPPSSDRDAHTSPTSSAASASRKYHLHSPFLSSTLTSPPFNYEDLDEELKHPELAWVADLLAEEEDEEEEEEGENEEEEDENRPRSLPSRTLTYSTGSPTRLAAGPSSYIDRSVPSVLLPHTPTTSHRPNDTFPSVSQGDEATSRPPSSPRSPSRPFSIEDELDRRQRPQSPSPSWSRSPRTPSTNPQQVADPAMHQTRESHHSNIGSGGPLHQSPVFEVAMSRTEAAGGWTSSSPGPRGMQFAQPIRRPNPAVVPTSPTTGFLRPRTPRRPLARPLLRGWVPGPPPQTPEPASSRRRLSTDEFEYSHIEHTQDPPPSKPKKKVPVGLGIFHEAEDEVVDENSFVSTSSTPMDQEGQNQMATAWTGKGKGKGREQDSLKESPVRPGSSRKWSAENTTPPPATRSTLRYEEERTTTQYPPSAPSAWTDEDESTASSTSPSTATPLTLIDEQENMASKGSPRLPNTVDIRWKVNRVSTEDLQWSQCDRDEAEPVHETEQISGFRASLDEGQHAKDSEEAPQCTPDDDIGGSLDRSGKGRW